jgi:dTDP-4-dehydrorhamnose reductase
MKVIIFGSTGMLGRYLTTYLGKYYETINISRPSFDALTTNIFDLNQLLGSLHCDAETLIINCIGVIPQRVNLDQSNQFIRINSEFPNLLSSVASRYQSKLIHITTDCVFSGKEGNYTESMRHDETNIYGVSKSLGEPINAMVIRTSIIGEELDNKKSFLEWVRSQKNQTVSGYDNHIWNGVTCLQLSKIIHQIMDSNDYWTGCRHIFSPNPITKYDLIKEVSDIYQLNVNVIRTSTPNDCNKTLGSIYETNGLFNIPDIRIQLLVLINYQLK